MPNPVASTTDRYIEMGRRFDTQRDGGRNMEVAMAATVFRDLQDAGHIPAGAKLADEPPGSGGSLSGTSYEARLVELIRDRDGNGRLDLDLDDLRSAGILTSSPDSATLENELTNGLRAELSDDFIGAQDRDSNLSRYGFPDARGRQVQAYSRGMILLGSQDRAQGGFVATAGSRARQGTGEANAVAREAIAGAQLLNSQGDQRHAQELLRDTGAALMDAGQQDAAASVYRELTRAPYASTQVNLMQHEVDAVARADRDYDAGDDIRLTSSNGTSSTIDVSDFRSTYGELAQQRLRQIETVGRMETALGRDVNPRDMDDAQAYFQSFAQGHSADEVRAEYQSYLESFYVHTGHGVTWSESVAEDERPGQMTDLLEGQATDASGRTLVDCEGYTYMTDHILGGVQTEEGERRFDVAYVQRPGHVISAVFDRTSGEGFSVNNDNTEMFTGDLSTSQGRANAAARAINDNNYNVVGFGERPSQADTTDDDGLPAYGSYIYDGRQIVGQTNLQFRQGYDEWRQQQFGNSSISHYIGHLDRQAAAQ